MSVSEGRHATHTHTARNVAESTLTEGCHDVGQPEATALEPAEHRGFDPRTVFGPPKFQRLLEVKRRYDPENVFHVNQNIKPA
jgi:Berberine and berberine like